MIVIDTLSNHWKELRGMVKRRWPALTNDDLAAINGNASLLVDLVQQRYGYARPIAQEKVDRFCESMSPIQMSNPVDERPDQALYT